MAPTPKVIEYFQSQSCSSCPPTTANLINLLPAHSADLNPTHSSSATLKPAPPRSCNFIFLSYHVPYHNHLDWTDTYAHPTFENRQHDYVKRLDLAGLYTPMIVLDGVVAGTGMKEGELKALLQHESVGERVRIEINADEEDANDQEVLINVERSAVVGDLEVFLVQYDPAIVELEVLRGENEGRVLKDWNVVRRLERIGCLSEEEGSSALLVEKKNEREGEAAINGAADRRATLEYVVLVQQGEGGPVVGTLCL